MSFTLVLMWEMTAKGNFVMSKTHFEPINTDFSARKTGQEKFQLKKYEMFPAFLDQE